MNRVLIVGFAVLLFGGVGLVHSEQKRKKGEDKDKAKPPAKVVVVAKPEAAKPPQSLPAKLAARTSFNGFDDPKFTLQDALDYLASQFEVRSDVQENAFRAAGYGDKSVLSEPVAVTPIPKMTGVTLDALIRKILGRITTPPGMEATYMIQGDGILITTANVLVSQIWGNNHHGPFFPLVHPSFDEKRLDEVLKELAEMSGHNIAVDKRLAAKGPIPVTIKMTNAPLDTAVRFLADMTELDTVFLDNVIYVTTKENAEAWQKKLQKERMVPEGDMPTGGPRIGTVPPVPTVPGSTPPGA